MATLWRIALTHQLSATFRDDYLGHCLGCHKRSEQLVARCMLAVQIVATCSLLTPDSVSEMAHLYVWVSRNNSRCSLHIQLCVIPMTTVPPHLMNR